MAYSRPVTRLALRLNNIPRTRASASASALQWTRYVHSSHSSKLNKAVVTDDHIAELAAKPLHPLTLGDLAKYDLEPFVQVDLDLD